MAIQAEHRTQLLTGRPDLYCRGPASALTPHGGIMFPNQPDIAYSQSVSYSSYDLVHTNYSFHAYRNTPSPSIQLTATFSQQTQEEHQYVLGVLHFLRSVTKMYYGISDVSQQPRAGTPPPVLRLYSFGSQQFNALPVVVGSFSTTYDSGVDLVEYNGQAVPVIQTFAIDLLVQQSPDRQKYGFSKHGFLSGQLYGGGFI
jgi:hypothetical protein